MGEWPRPFFQRSVLLSFFASHIAPPDSRRRRRRAAHRAASTSFSRRALKPLSLSFLTLSGHRRQDPGRTGDVRRRAGPTGGPAERVLVLKRRVESGRGATAKGNAHSSTSSLPLSLSRLLGRHTHYTHTKTNDVLQECDAQAFSHSLHKEQRCRAAGWGGGRHWRAAARAHAQ